MVEAQQNQQTRVPYFLIFLHRMHFLLQYGIVEALEASVRLTTCPQHINMLSLGVLICFHPKHNRYSLLPAMKTLMHDTYFPTEI